ncbi:MAG: hypothetical protein Q9M37_06450 [Desulfonauticus sp.]|nr:hypothetical protein [Desulfonauticus sp.]
MNSWLKFLFGHNSPLLFLNVGALLWLMLIPLGCLSLAVLTELFYLLNKRATFKKLSWQLSILALIILGAIGLLFGLICFVPSLQKNFIWMISSLKQALLVSLGLSLFFALIYVSLTNYLKKIKLIHFFLGVLALLSYKLFLIGWFLIFYHLFVPGASFVPPLQSLFYPIMGQLFILSLVFAISLIFPFLVIRRFKDDFGRDYYRFALQYLSKWNIVMLVVSFIPCVIIFLLLGDKFVITPLLGPGLMIVLTMLLLGLFSYWVLRSLQPMRLKVWFFGLWIPAYFLLVFRLVSYLKLLKMYHA